MKKENLLFGIIGLLAGLIGGFLLTNNYNRGNLAVQNAPAPNPAMMGQQTGSQQSPGAAMPQVAAALEKADKSPEDFDSQIQAGDMFARIKNFDKAITYFERANKIKPDDYKTIVALGNLYFDAQKPEKAAEWYEKALEKKKDDISVRTDYGLTYFLREPKDIDRAIKEYKASLAIDPNHEQTLQNLAVAYSEKKDAEGLKDTIAKLEKVNPNNQIIQKLKESK